MNIENLQTNMNKISDVDGDKTPVIIYSFENGNLLARTSYPGMYCTLYFSSDLGQTWVAVLGGYEDYIGGDSNNVFVTSYPFSEPGYVSYVYRITDSGNASKVTNSPKYAKRGCINKSLGVIGAIFFIASYYNRISPSTSVKDGEGFYRCVYNPLSNSFETTTLILEASKYDYDWIYIDDFTQGSFSINYKSCFARNQYVGGGAQQIYIIDGNGNYQTRTLEYKGDGYGYKILGGFYNEVTRTVYFNTDKAIWYLAGGSSDGDEAPFLGYVPGDNLRLFKKNSPDLYFITSYLDSVHLEKYIRNDYNMIVSEIIVIGAPDIEVKLENGNILLCNSEQGCIEAANKDSDYNNFYKISSEKPFYPILHGYAQSIIYALTSNLTEDSEICIQTASGVKRLKQWVNPYRDSGTVRYQGNSEQHVLLTSEFLVANKFVLQSLGINYY